MTSWTPADVLVRAVRRPLGLQILGASAVTLLFGSTVGTVLFVLFGGANATFGRYLLVTTSVVPYVAALVLVRIWCRRPAERDVDARPRTWWLLCLAAGLGDGVFGIALFPLASGAPWSFALPIAIVYPLQFAAVAVAADFNRALGRLVALGIGLALGALVAVQLMTPGRWVPLWEFSMLSLVLTVVAGIVLIPVALLQYRFRILAYVLRVKSVDDVEGTELPRGAQPGATQSEDAQPADIPPAPRRAGDDAA